MSEESANGVAQEGAPPEVSEQPPKKANSRKMTIGGVIVAAVILTISLLQFTTLKADDAPSAIDRFNASRSSEVSSTESETATAKPKRQYTTTEPDWTRYNRKRKTPIKSYKFEESYIRIKYKDGTVLLFTDDSCGAENVDEMQELAKKGVGLEDYIEENVEDDYEEKNKCSD